MLMAAQDLLGDALVSCVGGKHSGGAPGGGRGGIQLQPGGGGGGVVFERGPGVGEHELVVPRLRHIPFAPDAFEGHDGSHSEGERGRHGHGYGRPVPAGPAAYQLAGAIAMGADQLARLEAPQIVGERAGGGIALVATRGHRLAHDGEEILGHALLPGLQRGRRSRSSNDLAVPTALSSGRPVTCSIA